MSKKQVMEGDGNEVRDRSDRGIGKLHMNSGIGEQLGVKILLVNLQSIVNKVEETSVLIDMYEPDVVIGVESWLREGVGSSEVFPKGYEVYRRDRENGRGGGSSY